MNSISVVIITFNEENNIKRCLESILPIADEVIVVDSFSTDRTKEIADHYGAKFFLRTWEGYSSAKNFGNEKATKDWILSLDADEALDEILLNSLKEFKTQIIKDEAFEVNRLTNYCGYWVRYCGWYPDRKLRLWRKGEGAWNGVLHEEIVLKKSIKIVPLKGNLLHYSFPSINHHVKTLNSYSDVAAKELAKKNKKIFVLYHLIANPAFTFVRKYFFRLGFLDGYYGFVICVLSATANFLKYAKAIALKKAATKKVAATK
jgi:glycosyltransferase involved in cell wall biosynthesis